MADEPSPSDSSSPHETIIAVGIVVLILLIGAMAVWYFSHEPASPLPLLYQIKVNVNTADAEVIMLLPGVGDGLAQRIVEAREAGGPFADLKDLEKRVSGLGPAKMKPLASYLLFQSSDVPDPPPAQVPPAKPVLTPQPC
jgi:competence ComEA-like helix-hairpin-helix protein